MILVLLIILVLRVHLAYLYLRQGHPLCPQALPLAYSDLHRSLVCGAPLPFSVDFVLLQNAGLLHFVSGPATHFYFLTSWFDFASPVKADGRAKNSSRSPRSPLSRLGLTGLALLMCVASQFNPSMVRCLLAALTREISRWGKLFWRPAQIVLISGLCTLSLNPEWVNSFSLRLSWGAGLIAALLNETKWSRLGKFAVFWVGLSPLLLPLSNPQPLSIFSAWLMAPLICFFVYPLAWLTWLTHWGGSLFDGSWQIIFYLLRLFFSLRPETPFAVAALWQWGYLLALHLIAAIAQRQRAQKW